MTPEDLDKIGPQLDQAAENVMTHEDLADFVSELLVAYQNGHFEKQGVTDYLEGMEGLLAAMDGWCRNVWEMDKAPEQPDWRWMARLLHAAFWHS